MEAGPCSALLGVGWGGALFCTVGGRMGRGLVLHCWGWGLFWDCAGEGPYLAAKALNGRSSRKAQ